MLGCDAPHTCNLNFGLKPKNIHESVSKRKQKITPVDIREVNTDLLKAQQHTSIIT
jgi:hypothetical protein